MRVSFHKKDNPTPLSIIPFTIMMNHFAGTMWLINCSGQGMLETGKIKPDNRITGSINPINDIIIADCWVAAMVEIKIPNAKETIMNRTVSKPSRIKLPVTGTWNTKMLNRTMITVSYTHLTLPTIYSV